MSGWGIFYILVVCVAMPILAIRTARTLHAADLRPTIRQILRSTLATHGPLAGLALYTARRCGIHLFPPVSFKPQDPLAGVLFIALAMLVNLWRWHAQSFAQRQRLSWFRPQRASDLWPWLAISLIAGFSEEVVYRGVLLGLLVPAVGGCGGYWIAVGLCVLAFALGHWVQGRGAMLIVLLFAFGFHLLVCLSGDLYTAMIVHAVYDFLAGVLLWRLGRRGPPIKGARTGVPGADGELD